MSENELAQLRKALRERIVKDLGDGYLDLDETNVQLREYGLEPYGASFRRKCTVEFWIGWEDEDDAPYSHEFDSPLENFFEQINEDSAFVVQDPAAVTVEMGPILRGANLPS